MTFTIEQLASLHTALALIPIKDDEHEQPTEEEMSAWEASLTHEQAAAIELLLQEFEDA